MSSLLLFALSRRFGSSSSRDSTACASPRRTFRSALSPRTQRARTYSFMSMRCGCAPAPALLTRPQTSKSADRTHSPLTRVAPALLFRDKPRPADPAAERAAQVQILRQVPPAARAGGVPGGPEGVHRDAQPNLPLGNLCARPRCRPPAPLAAARAGNADANHGGSLLLEKPTASSVFSLSKGLSCFLSGPPLCSQVPHFAHDASGGARDEIGPSG